MISAIRISAVPSQATSTLKVKYKPSNYVTTKVNGRMESFLILLGETLP
jgi:hypothetical protein